MNKKRKKIYYSSILVSGTKRMLEDARNLHRTSTNRWWNDENTTTEARKVWVCCIGRIVKIRRDGEIENREAPVVPWVEITEFAQTRRKQVWLTKQNKIENWNFFFFVIPVRHTWSFQIFVLFFKLYTIAYEWNYDTLCRYAISTRQKNHHDTSFTVDRRPTSKFYI